MIVSGLNMKEYSPVVRGDDFLGMSDFIEEELYEIDFSTAGDERVVPVEEILMPYLTLWALPVEGSVHSPKRMVRVGRNGVYSIHDVGLIVPKE